MGRNKGLLLDRDGVINVDTNFVYKPEAFRFVPGVLSFLRHAVDSGYRLAIVTNQSGVARGMFTEAEYRVLQDWLVKAFRSEGLDLPLTLTCFVHPEGTVDPYCRESFWRKPNPGLLLEAAQKLDLDLNRSVMVGDAKRDMQAALAAGVSHGFWLTQAGEDLGPRITRVTDFDQLQSQWARFA